MTTARTMPQINDLIGCIELCLLCRGLVSYDRNDRCDRCNDMETRLKRELEGKIHVNGRNSDETTCTLNQAQVDYASKASSSARFLSKWCSNYVTFFSILCSTKNGQNGEKG